MPKFEGNALAQMELNEVKRARTFHEGLAQYEVTPLVRLQGMAKEMGLREIFVKDESARFGLNAFKALGGSYAMARYMETYGKKENDNVTFFTATDGNHGRGVAWAARQLGKRAVVYMPAGSSQMRLDNIRKEGAKAEVLDMNYDDCVRFAAKEAMQTPGGVILQDTAWEGYEEIPTWIMQGYGTMVEEAVEQMQQQGVERPTHVFVQAGVGSLAGAVVGYLVNRWKDRPPVFVLVEAESAACHYESALRGDGKTYSVSGDLKTIMAGLACGEVNPVSWGILRNYVSVFTAVPDWVAKKGMRMLFSPPEGDERVVSGESGAAPFGFLASVLQMDAYEELKDVVGLKEDSVVLLFSTEGDTDPEHYRKVVFDIDGRKSDMLKFK